MTSRLLPAMILSLLGLAASPSSAITLGQRDDFQSLSTSGWVSGPANPVQPTVVSSGGPAGSGDAYLFITATGGSGAGSRLVGINAAQWTGDYAAAGVSGIGMDVANFGSTALQLRLTFFGSGKVTDAVVLPAGAGWRRVQFGFDPATVGAFADLRIFHGFTDNAVFPGPAMPAQLGLDNITAVPEPGTAAAMGLGLLLLAARRGLAHTPLAMSRKKT